jgi:hypothetical protein
MTKKDWFHLFILLVLATVYLVWFTDWFKPKIIHIASISRASPFRRPRANGAEPAAIPPYFMLNPACKLTDLKVVRLSEWQTNHDAPPVWHLISISNSVPINKFPYGLNIRGMQPAILGTHAQALEPNVTYHMILKAGSARGEHDFETKPAD